MLLALAAVASTTASSAANPALVWSTSRFVADIQGRYTELSMLWIGAADGSRPRPLGEGRRPRLSPDGRWVAFGRDDHAYVVASTGGRSRLVARNADPIRWSPNSRLLATAAYGRALYVTDVETRRRVTIDRDSTIHGVSFSPSGREVVWARQPGRAYDLDGDLDLFRARVDGSRGLA